MSYFARCHECGARTKSVSLPALWPEAELGPIPEDTGKEGDDGKNTYWGVLEKHLLDKAANAWNRRTKIEDDNEI